MAAKQSKGKERSFLCEETFIEEICLEIQLSICVKHRHINVLKWSNFTTRTKGQGYAAVISVVPEEKLTKGSEYCNAELRHKFTFTEKLAFIFHPPPLLMALNTSMWSSIRVPEPNKMLICIPLKLLLLLIVILLCLQFFIKKKTPHPWDTRFDKEIKMLNKATKWKYDFSSSKFCMLHSWLRRRLCDQSRSCKRSFSYLPEGESDCSSDTFNGVKTTRGTVLFTIIETPFLLFCCCLKAYKNDNKT